MDYFEADVERSICFYFIPSSEFNAYLKQIKVLLSAVKKYHIFLLVTDKIYIFSLQQTSCLDNLGLNFLPEKIWNAPFLSDITLRMYVRQIKQMTSHFDVIFELM